jgi:hypothetical protein
MKIEDLAKQLADGHGWHSELQKANVKQTS